MHQNFNQVNHKKPENIQLFRISSKLMLYQAPQKVELCSTNYQSTIFLMIYRQLICFQLLLYGLDLYCLGV